MDEASSDTAIFSILMTEFIQFKKKFLAMGGQVQLLAETYQRQKSNHRTVMNSKFCGTIRQGKIQGSACYYEHNFNPHSLQKQYFTLFYGEVDQVTGRRIKAGVELLVIANLRRLGDLSKENFQIQQSKAQFLQNWGQVIEGSHLPGILIHEQKNSNQKVVFNGMFSVSMNQPFTFNEGQYTLFVNQKPVICYQGTFLNNQFHGEGQLLFVDKYQYKGEFKNGLRNGFGSQENFIQKTQYIGEFQDGRQHGHGKLIYKNKGNIQLRGFWEGGFIKNKEGVFFTERGEILQTYEQ